jgi:hypothetical protein
LHPHLVNAAGDLLAEVNCLSSGVHSEIIALVNEVAEINPRQAFAKIKQKIPKMLNPPSEQEFKVVRNAPVKGVIR